jgi:hypothetical protein
MEKRHMSAETKPVVVETADAGRYQLVYQAGDV